MWWSVHPRRLERALLKRAASQYARHGWPVMPGSYPYGARFTCDRAGCPTQGCHPAFEEWQSAASCDPLRVAGWWSRRHHSVLLATGIAFDVIEGPPHLGERTLRLLAGAAGPCAVTPAGRWMFFVNRGAELRAELALQPHVLLHAQDSWVPAPPTRFPEGQVRWRISPSSVVWRLPDPRRVEEALLSAAGERRYHSGPISLRPAGPALPATGRRRSSGRPGGAQDPLAWPRRVRQLAGYRR